MGREHEVLKHRQSSRTIDGVKASVRLMLGGGGGEEGVEEVETRFLSSFVSLVHVATFLVLVVERLDGGGTVQLYSYYY